MLCAFFIFLIFTARLLHVFVVERCLKACSLPLLHTRNTRCFDNNVIFFNLSLGLKLALRRREAKTTEFWVPSKVIDFENKTMLLLKTLWAIRILRVWSATVYFSLQLFHFFFFFPICLLFCDQGVWSHFWSVLANH